MKKFTLACLLAALSACKKFDGGDNISPRNNRTTTHDTIPDHASFTLRLSKDNTDYDETAFLFNYKAGTVYNAGNDAAYFPGFGQVSLCSVSSDGKNMAIYELPYKPHMQVGLTVNSTKDASLNLEVCRANGIPDGIHLWIKDAYSRDSLDLRRGPYSFKIKRADTNSYGSKRFKLVLVSGTPVYWAGN